MFHNECYANGTVTSVTPVTARHKRKRHLATSRDISRQQGDTNVVSRGSARAGPAIDPRQAGTRGKNGRR